MLKQKKKRGDKMPKMFLREIGFSDKLIERMLNSYIAKTYSDEQLKKKFEEMYNFLLKLGYSKKTIMKMADLFPSLFTKTIEDVKIKIDFFLKLGFNLKEFLRMFCLFPNTVSYSKEFIEEKVILLMSFGLTKKETLKIIKDSPGIIALSKSNIENSIKDIL